MNFTWRATPRVAAEEAGLGKASNFPFQSPKGDLCQRPAGIHQYVPAARQVCAVQSKYLAQTALQPIAQHGIPQACWCRDPKTRLQ